MTPRISKENNVIMHVKPEVSSGEINPITELPEEETTHVETALMLPDGHGMVIGGLIQESDVETESKIPVLGDLWLVGRLFQFRQTKRKRTEIVIALIPHVVPYDPLIQQRECQGLCRATTPLLYGPVLQNPRHFEPRFPNAGQKLPFSYKTEHLRTTPDSGRWGPRRSEAHCAPGVPAMPPGAYDAMPFQPGVVENGELRETGEMIPTPAPGQTY